MRGLTDADMLSLLEFIRESYSASNIETFAQRVISRLSQLVPSEITTYNKVDPRKQKIAWWESPAGAIPRGWEGVFEQHMREHPLIRHYQKTRDGRALKISDFLTRNQFHRSLLYNEFFRELGVEHQMAFTLPTPPPHIIGISLNRGQRDFTERDRLVLNLLRPHLIQAYRNAEIITRLQRKLGLASQVLDKVSGVIVVGGGNRVRLLNAQAQHLVEGYFGIRSLRGSRLPEVLETYIREKEGQVRAEGDVPPPRKPLVVERAGKCLAVHLISDADRSLLLLEERLMELRPASLHTLGLSRREAEVLFWVAQGKTNAEIGAILGMSSHTVKRHLDHIYQKLGVENRTAAAMRVLREATSGPPI